MPDDSMVHIVDDDAAVRDSLQWLMESVGIAAKAYDSAQAFLRESEKTDGGCLLLDVRLRDMSGLELQRRLIEQEVHLPIIFITGHGEVDMAVQAMKNGAVDFVTKPFDDQKLLDSVQRVLSRSRAISEKSAKRALVRRRLASLSPRERQVLDKVIEGKLNKTIANELNISNKTVEAHRARMMDKMQAHNLAELVRQITLIDQDH
jgi:FixJ family two-component response regulator